jgi:hypothetical protein
MLKKILTFSALTISLNVTSVNDRNQFNKEAYINLNQEYSYNDYTAPEKKKGMFDSLFTGTFSSIRNELGSTDSDNMGQLGSRISNNLKNKVINNSISQVEQFINKTANEFVNNTGRSNRANNINDDDIDAEIAEQEFIDEANVEEINENLDDNNNVDTDTDTDSDLVDSDNVDIVDDVEVIDENLDDGVDITDATDNADSTDDTGEIDNADNDKVAGKTNISITISNNPTFSIKTIQPLTNLTNDSTSLTFMQAQLNSGEVDGEFSNNFNVGVGQRFLFGNKKSIVGVNLFNDYELESSHHRISLGLEYQRANFSANFNKYFAISEKINDNEEYSEEALSGLDIRLTGQVPFLPWAKVKASHYIWDKTDSKDSEDISGTILGVEVQLNPALSVEVGTEISSSESDDEDNVDTYVTLNAQLPFKGITTLNNLGFSKKAFASADTIRLADLKPVERSSKIRIERVLNNTSLVSGVYNSATVGAQCTLYNSSGVAIKNGSGKTSSTGSLTLYSLSVPEGLISMQCVGGSYIDEATGQVVNPAPTLNAATVRSGSDDLTLIVSPLSEIAYMLAGGSNNDNLADVIDDKNILIAKAFGIKDVDIIATTPTDINIEVVQDDNAGKFGLILAAISQMSENAGDDVLAGSTSIIDKLYADMSDGIIDGDNGVDVITAINNFKNSAGTYNDTDGTGVNNTGDAESSTGEGSVMGDLAIIKIDAYDGENSVITLEDYINAGVVGVTENNLLAVNSHMINYDVSTTAKIQTRVNASVSEIDTAIAKISNYDGTNSIPTVQDYTSASVSGVNTTNLNHVNDEMALTHSDNSNTAAKIQSVVNEAVNANFILDTIANVLIDENTIFVGVKPTVIGDKPVGLTAYTLEGDDASLATIDAVTGVVTMVGHNFEDPEDFNKDNIYEITIVLTDAEGNAAYEQQTITIANINESANFTISSINNISIIENSDFSG